VTGLFHLPQILDTTKVAAVYGFADPIGCEKTKRQSVRRVSTLFTFLIVLSVGCAETPEFFTLCDDNSNDFVETVPSGRVEPAVQIHQEPNGSSSLSGRGSSLRIDSHLSFHSPQRFTLSGQDLLLLLSIHRK